MKSYKYIIIETDVNRENAEILKLFSNKAEAKKECARLARLQTAGNGLRRAEGSKERCNNRYFVINTSADLRTKINVNDIIYGI